MALSSGQALSTGAGASRVTGYEPPYQPSAAMATGGGGGSSMSAVAQLFARLSQEIEESKPKNCIHFIVDFLCKHYPEHLHGFASIWQMDPDLERERHEVVNFFKAHKISTAVAAHFTNAGYDTLDTLTTLSPDSLLDVEAFNNVKWLPGHKVRLQQIFGEISARVRAYRQQQQANDNGPRFSSGGVGQYGASGGSYAPPTAPRYSSPSAAASVQQPMIRAAPTAAGYSPGGGLAAGASYTPSLLSPDALGGRAMAALPAPGPISYVAAGNPYTFN